MKKSSSPATPEARARLETEFARAVAHPDVSPLVSREREALFPRFARYHARLTRLPRRTRRALQRQWRRSLGALALLLALGQAPALANTIEVTTNVPDIDGIDGECSLIEAIENANDDNMGNVHSDCAPGTAGGADTIQILQANTHTLTAVDNNYANAGNNGVPAITSAITIEGNGSTITRDPDADEPFRIFAVASSGNLTLNETTVSGGVATAFGSGGGVYNRGTATLTHSTVSGNSAGSGGGVFDRGTLTLTNSTVSGNSAGGSGGGVDNVSGTLTLTNTTVSGNSASFGGGVDNRFGTLTLTNSTVSGNSAGGSGGGVSNVDGTVTLHRSLISGNTASSGSEVGLQGPGTVIANDFNLFGANGNAGVTGFDPGEYDVVPMVPLTNILETNLVINGGTTRTHALVADSPAIDAITTECPPPTTDQRSVSRPQDGDGDGDALCDIGAYEFVPADVEEALTAEKDSFLRRGNPDRNEGANPGLRLQAAGDNRVVVGFDPDAIGGFGNVTAATLVLTIAENADNWGRQNDRTVDVHALLEDFAEGDGRNAGVPGSQSTRGSGPGVTWNCAIDTEIANQRTDCASKWNGGTFGAASGEPVLHVNGLSGAVTWDVTEDVRAGASAWLIKKTDEGQSGKVSYFSREGAGAAGDPGLAPRLILERLPNPDDK